MKKIVLFLLVAVMVFAFSVSVMADSAEKTPAPSRPSKQTNDNDSSAEDDYYAGFHTKPVVVQQVVTSEEPTVDAALAKFDTLDKEDVQALGAVKKGASLTFTPGKLANYYLLVFVNGQWVAYKIPAGATSISIPVDSNNAIVAGSNTPLAGALSL